MRRFWVEDISVVVVVWMREEFLNGLGYSREGHEKSAGADWIRIEWRFIIGLVPSRTLCSWVVVSMDYWYACTVYEMMELTEH